MNKQQQIKVAEKNTRNYAYAIAKLWLSKKVMPKQAKTLSTQELRRVLDHIATSNHALRNRAMLLITYHAGLRVGEVAALRYGDVVAQDGSIKAEIHLRPEQTKGSHSRVVFLGERIRKELATYVKANPQISSIKPLFYTQKREGFSANTLCQHFFYLYQQAGIRGASSHSGRRTFITTLASKGIGVRVLMHLAGHRSISTTQAYIDVNDDMKRRAVELV